jgi:serine protease inhibitor
MTSTRTRRLPFLQLSFLIALAVVVPGMQPALSEDKTETAVDSKNLQINSDGPTAPAKKPITTSGKSTAKFNQTKPAHAAKPTTGKTNKATTTSTSNTNQNTAPGNSQSSGGKTESVSKSDNKTETKSGTKSEAKTEATPQSETKSEIAKPAAGAKGATLVQSENSFGLATYRTLGDTAPTKNLFISPFSMHTCLHLVFNGAAGKTATEMGRVLGLSKDEQDKQNQEFVQLNEELQPIKGSDSPAFVFSTANAIWANNDVKLQPTFASTSKSIFGAEVRNLDFGKSESVSAINSWVSDETHGKIAKILDKLTADETLVAVNAAYFKARWKTVFNKQWTKDADFKAPAGAKKVSMMDARGSFHYLENDQMQAIELPYEGGKTSLVVFLPKDKTNLDDLRHSLSLTNWDAWVNKMEVSPGELFLPKFTTQYQVFCRDFLTGAGMKDAFSKSADFSQMVLAPATTRLSQVVHKTFVKVDEEGTEAAAATAVVERALSLLVEHEAEPFKMVVDRPFFFAVMNWKTHAILFVGQITDPSEG